MRKFFILGCVCCLLTACFWHKKNSSAPTVDTAAPSEVAVTQEPEKQELPPVEEILPDTKPTVKTVAPTTTTTTSPTKTASTPVAKNNSTKTTPSEPEIFDTKAAEKLIQSKRASQTLSQPQPDTLVFKDEDIISTEGRRLSPFSYEPVVQTQTQTPWSKEELKYGVYYSFIKAGTAYIKNRGLTTVNGHSAYLIQTTAFSASVIDSVFKVRDVNYSWIDAENFYSLGYVQSLREGNYVRDEWVTFDFPNKRYYGEVKKKKDPRTIAGELNQQVLDMLSSLYYVRAQKLEVGKDIVFDIINREEQYPLVVKVTGKETIKTAAGKFHCFVVEPQFRGEGIFVSKGKNLKVWITDDKYKMPVKMQTEVFIGNVSADLLEYKRN